MEKGCSSTEQEAEKESDDDDCGLKLVLLGGLEGDISCSVVLATFKNKFAKQVPSECS